MATLGTTIRIKEAVESFFKQKKNDKTLVIVDDSGVGAVSVALNDPRIILLKNQENLGFTKSLNVALAYLCSSGMLNREDTLCILDDDDTWINDNKIGIQQDYLDKYPEVDLVACSANLVRNGAIIGTIPDKFGTITPDIIKQKNPIVHSSIMVRASMVLDGEFIYNENLVRSQDWEHWIRLICWRGIKIVILNENMVNYTVDSSLISRFKKKRKDLAANKLLMRIHPELKLATNFIEYIFQQK